MSIFNFNEPELLTFFAVLVRYSVLIALMPIVGDRAVPVPVKILLSLAVSMALFPALVSRGQIQPGAAVGWGATPSGIIFTVGGEAVFGLLLSFVARLAFDTVTFGGNLVGTFMGLATASTYDPHQETQTQVVSQFQLALATLIFLAVDGHHLMLRAALDSYRVVGLGGTLGGLGQSVSQRLVEITGQVIRFGIQFAAPVAISMFAVNVAFGVVAKSMPQLNVLVLSFAAGSLVCLGVLFLSLPEFAGATQNLFSRADEWMLLVMRSVAQGR
jgi:flagellar biosynthetic protein FliR